MMLTTALATWTSLADPDSSDPQALTEGHEQHAMGVEHEVEMPAAPVQGPALEASDEDQPDDKKIGLTLSPSLRLPLGSGSDIEGGRGTVSGERGADAGPVLGLSARYIPATNWFVQGTLYHYLDKEKRRPWNGDFSYGFGYDNPRPNSWSVTYTNYTNNRISPQEGEPVTRVALGTGNVIYKFRAPSAIQIEPTLPVNCRVGYHVQPRYERALGGDGSWKQASSLGCTYPVWKMLYIEGTAYGYLSGEKQSWDPDFTYSFGWFDWRPGRISVQYANYAGNRLPSSSSRGTGGFKRGSLVVSWRTAL
jgi:hypothetical protein